MTKQSLSQEASAAWQDVQEALTYAIGLVGDRLRYEAPYFQKVLQRYIDTLQALPVARAADAQQIAALREDVRRKDETITLLMGRVEDLEGRIGNALA